MAHDSHGPANAATETVQMAARVLLPLTISAAVTAGGVFVFFALVTAVLG
ncbi:hypothetical protein [Natrinema sp. SYSU A 869]|nr:hypothetical protein [Natrinema sp. SYSU A 869]